MMLTDQLKVLQIKVEVESDLHVMVRVGGVTFFRSDIPAKTTQGASVPRLSLIGPTPSIQLLKLLLPQLLLLQLQLKSPYNNDYSAQGTCVPCLILICSTHPCNNYKYYYNYNDYYSHSLQR